MVDKQVMNFLWASSFSHPQRGITVPYTATVRITWENINICGKPHIKPHTNISYPSNFNSTVFFHWSLFCWPHSLSPAWNPPLYSFCSFVLCFSHHYDHLCPRLILPWPESSSMPGVSSVHVQVGTKSWLLRLSHPTAPGPRSQNLDVPEPRGPTKHAKKGGGKGHCKHNLSRKSHL